MDHTRFDSLVKSLATRGTRRRLLGRLAVLPVAGAVAALITGLDGSAAAHPGERVQKRRDHHRHRARRRQDQHHDQQTRDNGNDGNNGNNGNNGNVGNGPYGPDYCLPTMQNAGCTLRTDNTYSCPPGTNLRDAYLVECTFFYAELQQVDLTRAQLTEARFFNAILIQAILKQATLTGANFDSADLRHADFTGATVHFADWYGATCPDGFVRNQGNNTCCEHFIPGQEPVDC